MSTTEPAVSGGSSSAPEPSYLSHKQILVVLAGLMAGMFLAALDQSIVGTALPQIVSEFNSLDKLSWVVTAYLLTSTASTPLWGKISDLYGRRPLFIAAIVTFLAGSVLSALAQNIEELIGFRAVQGLGAGGLMSLAFATIGDVIPPRERGKYMGYFGAVFGLSSVAGPLLGGLLTDGPGWRWIFWINLPIGLVALGIVAAVLKLPHVKRSHKIDYLGASVITAAVTTLLLAISWSGPDNGWGSGTTIALLVAAVVLSVTFVFVELKVAEPIIPMDLFKGRIFSGYAGYAFLLGFAMFGALIFLPLYLQAVKDMSPTRSGLALLPMIVGIFSASIPSGQLMSKTGRYKIYPIISAVLVGGAMVMLSTIGMDTPYWQLAIYMFVMGAGLGLSMQITVTAAQNSVPRQHMGTATSTMTFFRSMGGAIGTAVYGAVLTSRLTDHLGDIVPQTAQNMVGMLAKAANSVDALHALQQPMKGWALLGLVQAMGDVFLVSLPFLVIALVLAIITPEQRLAGRNDNQPKDENIEASAAAAMH
ncbi:EmrB/QacA subfamily drug resistance transporter [Kribbella sp. VKM Ac-2527]|uniref:EmrB/QacA subfamily drug resistance transporter n=1 Tax=Kribbella caucasensis TaxID=2512215 RepID=A0A4V6PT19_9ACTN|nr:MDR family MFS transporter [Kribbella sp. VKM Ac-2527]TDO45074.1 EmrB/QacA subfamily drug resistance transporter [Kribbella sp. VKM Ac-2527]